MTRVCRRGTTTLIIETSFLAARFAFLVDQPGGPQHQEPRLVDLHPGKGDPFGDGAMLMQFLAEGFALPSAFAHELQGKFALADGAHAVMNTSGAETGLGKSKAFALLAEEVADGYPDIIEHHLAMAFRGGVMHDREVALLRSARGCPSAPGPWNGGRELHRSDR